MPEYGDLPHPCGTVSGWHRGCRCGECRGAHAAEVARYRARQAWPRPPRPGAEGTYPLGPDAGADADPPAPFLGAGGSPAPASTAPPVWGGTWQLVGLVLILVLIALALRRGGRTRLAHVGVMPSVMPSKPATAQAGSQI